MGFGVLQKSQLAMKAHQLDGFELFEVVVSVDEGVQDLLHQAPNARVLHD